MPEKDEFALLNSIVGERLIGVQFIMDYFKLDFGVAEMTILSPAWVSISGNEYPAFQYGFRDQICSSIGVKVDQANGVIEKSIDIMFEGDASVIISLKIEDRDGPEAVFSR